MKKYLVKIYLIILRYKENSLPNLFLKTPFLSALYYLLFSNAFKREQHATLVGKMKHLKEIESGKSNIYTLIRNIHRIEKGLLMKPRRDLFALGFIGETIDAFESIYFELNNSFESTLSVPSPGAFKFEDNDEGNSQFKWFHDVLTEFFKTTGKHETIEKNRIRFLSITKAINICKHKNMCSSIPFCRQEINKTTISFDEFYKLTQHRRSVRWFLEQDVPHELIEKAILAANQSPSACNRQPLTYRIIDDRSMLDEISSLPMGTKGFEKNIPMMIVVIGHLDAFFSERDRHIIYIDASLAYMSLMLALETLGLSSCSINWPDIEYLELKMEKCLALKKHERPIMALTVGYPDPLGMVAYSEKRNINDIIVYNR